MNKINQRESTKEPEIPQPSSAPIDEPSITPEIPLPNTTPEITTIPQECPIRMVE